METGTENEIDIDEMTYECKYDIGTMFHDPIGGVWKYVKITFGIYPEGEACIYQWLSWNGLAHLEKVKL